MLEYISYLEISYPNFVLGAIIDPEEANQNNHDIVTKANEIVERFNSNLDDVLSKADFEYVNDKFTNIEGSGRTTETIFGNAKEMIKHKTSSDHDERYYTKAILNDKQWETKNIKDGAVTAEKLDPGLISGLELTQYIGIAENIQRRLEIISILGV